MKETINADFCAKSIFVDGYDSPYYGSDQVYDTFPIRFATVQFELVSTDGLTKLADAVRVENGFLPMLLDETNGNYDMDGWYDFYVTINDYGDYPICDIEFIPVNSEQEDNERMYSIELSDSEMIALYNRLNEQAVSTWGMTCREMLDDAKEEFSA